MPFLMEVSAMNEQKQKNDVALLLIFDSGETIKIDIFSAIDIARNKQDYNINLTNLDHAFLYDNLYDQILNCMGETKFFTVEIHKNNHTKTATQMTAHYYSTDERELLTITKYIELNTEENKENESV